MGRSGRTLLAVAFLIGGSALAAELPIRSARWIKGADPVAALTQQPAECLKLPGDPAALQSIEVGRAVFRSPTLLGGQAARQGISCDSCHRNGRGNPAFHFPGLSGDPGTADVTSALFSSHRDDGALNPKRIPDLGAPERKVLRAQMSGFLHGAITEEFNGPAPSPAVVQGLADYMRAIEPESCPAAATVPVTAEAAFDNARRAVRAALHSGDPATAQTLLDAARAMLGQIDERYPGVEVVRAELRLASRDLAAAQADIRAGRDTKAPLSLWLARSGALEHTLKSAEDRSLYDRKVLGRLIAR